MALISTQKLKNLLIHEDGAPEFSQHSDSQAKLLIDDSDQKVQDKEIVVEKHHERAE